MRDLEKQVSKYFARFSAEPPAEQNAIDLLSGAWTTDFPGVSTGGGFNGCNDGRIQWLKTLCELKGKKVLELGPLEGAHTFMLEQAGAEVTAIEANHGAFLRCLIAKNLLNMKARFLLGDFEKFDFGSERFDLLVASGVLYHLKDPGEFLKWVSQAADRLFVWTHYFEPDTDRWHPNLQKAIRKGKWETKNVITTHVDGVTVRLVRQRYGDSLGWSGFCGGTDTFSHWMFREDLLSLVERLGYRDIQVNFDQVDHQNGPAFAFFAEK
ncbi:MAG: methyltransferase domain-containing protein [Pseudomonadota bacterium]